MAQEGITKKDMLFIDEYFNNGFNGSLAYKTIFNPSANKSTMYNGQRLLNKPHIKLEVERRWDEIRSSNIVRREEIMLHLKELMFASITNKDNNTLLKTIDMINKMTGTYVTQIEANINQSIILNIPGLETPEEDDENDKEE